MMTRGIVAREDATEILRFSYLTNLARKRSREHDFGALEVGKDTIFWKLDYYNRSLRSPNPRTQRHPPRAYDHAEDW